MAVGEDLEGVGVQVGFEVPVFGCIIRVLVFEEVVVESDFGF